MEIYPVIKIGGSNDFSGKSELYIPYYHSYAIYGCGENIIESTANEL